MAGESRGTVRAIFEAVDRITAPVRRIGAGVGSIIRNLNLATAREQLGRVVQGINDVGRAALDMGKKLVAGATAGAVAVAALTRSVAESTLAAQTAARTVNVSLQGWQQFGHAANLVGSNADQMSGALGSLRDKALEAARGNWELRRAFRLMGVQLTDNRGRLRDTESLMMDVADAFARVPDSERRTRAAMELFGEAGAALIPILSQGSAGMRAAARDAQFLGITLSRTEAQAVTTLGISMRRLTGSITGVWNAIAVRLSPIITPLVNDLTQWIATNRELIATKVEEYIRAIPGAVQSLRDQAQALWSTLRPVVAVFIEWAEWFGPLHTAALALGLYLGGGLAMSVLRLAGSIAGPMFGAIIGFIRHLRTGIGVMAAFNAVMLANPIGLVIAGIVLLGGAAYLLYRNWSSIPGWFRDLWEGVKRLFSAFVAWVRGWAPGVMAGAVAAITAVWRVLAIWFGTLWRTWVTEPFNWFVRWVDGWTGGAATAAVNAIKAVWRELGAAFTSLWQGDVAGAFNRWIAWVDSWTDGAATVARDRFLAVWRGVKDFFIGIWNEIEARFRQVWDFIRPAIERVERLFSRTPRAQGDAARPPGSPRAGTLGGSGRAEGYYAPTAPPAQPTPGGATERVDAGGVIELRITSDGVTVTRNAPNDPRFQFRPSDETGRVMATD